MEKCTLVSAGLQFAVQHLLGIQVSPAGEAPSQLPFDASASFALPASQEVVEGRCHAGYVRCTRSRRP
jgi:hypothetical protein